MEIPIAGGHTPGPQGRDPRRRLLRLVAVLLLVLTAGCGRKQDGLYPVRGTVTLDGSRIEEGRILFRKVGGDQRAFSAEIVEGKYQLETQAGEMTVEITGSRIIPGKFTYPGGAGSEPVPYRESYIPDKYSTETSLTAEVAPVSRGNEFPFELTSQGEQQRQQQ